MSTSIQRSRVNQLQYARARESQHLLWIHTQDRRITKEISDITQNAMEAILKEAAAWTTNYAGIKGISMAEALLAARTDDIEALARKAKVYVKTLDFSPEANAEMKLYNFSMKMSRGELLFRNIDLERIATGNDVQKVLTSYLEDMSLAELNRQAVILGMTVSRPEDFSDLAKTIANESFHGTKFSDRIWQNQKELTVLIERGVSKSLLLGQNPVRWMNELRGRLTPAFQGSAYALKRLAVTESARAQIASQKAAYEAGGYDWFEFIAEPTACEICRALDGKVAKVKTMSMGGNAPPIHPNCKCSTAAFYDIIDEQGVDLSGNRYQQTDSLRTSGLGGASEIPGDVRTSLHEGRTLGRTNETFGAGINRELPVEQPIAKSNGGSNFGDFLNADAKTFHDSMENAMAHHPNKEYVEIKSVEDYEKIPYKFLHTQKDSGICVTQDGDIVSVFNGSSRRGELKQLMPIALDNGGIKLDNFDGGLSDLYTKYGFEPISKTKFVDEFAPPGWDLDKNGRPDIVFWSHNGDDLETVIRKSETSSYQKYDISKIPDFPDYDSAAAFRDESLK